MYNTGSNVCLYNNAAMIAANSEELPHGSAHPTQRKLSQQEKGKQFQKTKNCDTDA